MAVTKVPRIKIPKTRNGGTMTEAAFWYGIRSALRRKSMYWWKPIQNVLLNARRPSQSNNARLKWEYICSECKEWFPRDQVEVDHLIEAGSLKCLEDLPRFVENLFCEEEHLVVLCKCCHNKKTFKTESL